MADTVINSVQRGSALIASADTSDTVTLDSTVDTSKSILFYSATMEEGSNPGQERVIGYLTDGDTITFTKQSSGLDINVYYYVAEFSSGVYVQRGQEIDPSSSTVDVTIDDVGDISKCFVMTAAYYHDNTYNRSGEPITGYLTSTTNLRLEGAGSGTGSAWTWQVVKIDNATVQTDTFTISAGNSTATETITSVDTDKTFVIAGARDSATKVVGSDDWAISVDLTNATTLTARRGGSDRSFTVRYHVVTLSDSGFSVQHGDRVIDSNAAEDVTISSVDLDRSVALSGGDDNYCMITTASDSTKGISKISTTLKLTSTTNLAIESDGCDTGATNTSYWSVLEFPGAAAAGRNQLIWIPSV